ncbi:MAG: lamin tail domain-containing protein, partial [Bacteroidota bacterium]
VSNYVVTEGDEISVYGSIDQFSGLTEIVPDSIFVLSTGNQLPDTVTVTVPTEMTESRLIHVEDYWVVDPAQWPSANASANIDLTNGTDTITMRIDGDNNVADSIPVAPADTFDVYGIGGQFDNSNPFTEGYQILPRYYTDIVSGSQVVPPPVTTIPSYTISQVHTEDADGVADSLNVTCKLTGIVYGVDNRGGNGYSFTIIDNTGGMNVFSFNDVDNYVVQEGDEIRVIGSIDQFNGLTEIIPDSIVLISTGNALKAPVVVTTLMEANESDFLRIEGVRVIDPSQWPSGGSSNVQLETPCGDTVVMRIDSDTDVELNIPSAPTVPFTLLGIGGQFDNSSPFTEGYQIFPRFFTDIDTTLPAGEQLFINELMPNNVVTVADGSGDFDDWIELYNPNGAAVDIANYTISDDPSNPAKFRFDGCDPATEIPASDFTLVWADNETSEGALHVNFELDEVNGGWVGLWGPDGQLIDSLSYPALGADDSYGRETDGASSFVIFSINPTPDAPNMISSTGDNLSAIGNTLIVYPNPAGNEVVNLNRKADINVVNLLGQPVMTGRQVNQIDVTDWESGVYFIRTEDGRTAKLVVR